MVTDTLHKLLIAFQPNTTDSKAYLPPREFGNWFFEKHIRGLAVGLIFAIILLVNEFLHNIFPGLTWSFQLIPFLIERPHLAQLLEDLLQVLVIPVLAVIVTRQLRNLKEEPRAKTASICVERFMAKWKDIWMLWVILYIAITVQDIGLTSTFQKTHGALSFADDKILNPRDLLLALKIDPVLHPRSSGPTTGQPKNPTGMTKTAPPTDAAMDTLIQDLSKISADSAPDSINRSLQTALNTFVGSEKTAFIPISSDGIPGYLSNLIIKANNDKEQNKTTRINRFFILNRFSNYFKAQTIPKVAFFINLFNNVSALYIYLVFMTLKRPDEEVKVGKDIANVLLVFLPLLALDVVGFATAYSGLPGPQMFASWVSGFLSAIAIALLVGRLESRWISTPLSSIIVLYGYAAIQPAFGAYDSLPGLKLFVLGYALIGKVLLFFIMSWIIDERVLLYYMCQRLCPTAAVKADQELWDRQRAGIAFYSPKEIELPLELMQKICRPRSELSRSLMGCIPETHDAAIYLLENFNKLEAEDVTKGASLILNCILSKEGVLESVIGLKSVKRMSAVLSIERSDRARLRCIVSAAFPKCLSDRTLDNQKESVVLQNKLESSDASEGSSNAELQKIVSESTKRLEKGSKGEKSELKKSCGETDGKEENQSLEELKEERPLVPKDNESDEVEEESDEDTE